MWKAIKSEGADFDSHSRFPGFKGAITSGPAPFISIGNEEWTPLPSLYLLMDDQVGRQAGEVRGSKGKKRKRRRTYKEEEEEQEKEER